VPDSLDLLTPYVLREQGQWFEKEIGFLGAFLKPGMQAIDIGANYGVYTLTMAGILGPAGTLWAFEPTSTTAACLGDSLTENRFGNVTLVQAALSDRVGTATLGLNPNSELNSLSVTPGAESEEVPVMTLDGCMAEFGWRHMDFIKLDAEGHEDNILRGGQSFLDAFWPLIMFEFKNGAEVNLSLIESFAGLGYSSYRYVPGLGALVPFASGEAPDQFELNLFCCKDDTASRLERDGILVTAAASGKPRFPRRPVTGGNGSLPCRTTPCSMATRRPPTSAPPDRMVMPTWRRSSCSWSLNWPTRRRPPGIARFPGRLP